MSITTMMSPQGNILNETIKYFPRSGKHVLKVVEKMKNKKIATYPALDLEPDEDNCLGPIPFGWSLWQHPRAGYQIPLSPSPILR